MISKELVKVHQELVAPVCALEEYIDCHEPSSMLDCICQSLKRVLDDIENERYEEKK